MLVVLALKFVDAKGRGRQARTSSSAQLLGSRARPEATNSQTASMTPKRGRLNSSARARRPRRIRSWFPRGCRASGAVG
eukprot:8106504-Pyramimonas_sp.AAC.1